jgi:hypothetical protein
MSNLTRQIKNNEGLKSYLKKIQPKLMKISDMKSARNHYPDWIGQKKLWALMGTYTDYIIRKMISEKYTIPLESKLICEISSEKLQGNKNIPSSIKKSYTELNTWIADFKSNKSSWTDILEDAFYMAQTDSLYRAGDLSQRIELPSELIPKFQKFFTNIWDFLPQLGLKKPILLNPTLGIPNCPADADLIDDTCIFDFKTSKYPPKKEDIFQLLGYASLYFHQSSKKSEFVAIFNPIFLGIQKYDIKNITTDDLAQIVHFLEKR